MSRTLPPRPVLIVTVLAMLLGVLAMTAAGRPAVAQPNHDRGDPGSEPAHDHRGPDDGRTHQRPDHRRCALDRGAHNLRACNLGTDQH